MDTLKFRTRRGKIARLPNRIRHELNQRLENGDPGPELLAWLNALPEVQALLAARFGGRPIRQQNLSEWRLGGWQDWMQEQHAIEAVRRIPGETQESMATDGVGRPSLAESLTHWLCLRYVMHTRRIDAAEADGQWHLLRQFTGDIVRLQRAQIDNRRLARQREYDLLYRPQSASPAPKPAPPHPIRQPAKPSTTSTSKSTATAPAKWPASPAPRSPKPLESQMSPAKLQTSGLIKGGSFTLGHLPKPA